MAYRRLSEFSFHTVTQLSIKVTFCEIGVAAFNSFAIFRWYPTTSSSSMFLAVFEFQLIAKKEYIQKQVDNFDICFKKALKIILLLETPRG